MTVRAYYGVSGVTTGPIDPVNTVIPVSPSLLGAIISSGFIPGVDTAYFSLSTGNKYELVKVVGYGADSLHVQRGLPPLAWPTGTTIKWELTAEYVREGMPVPPTLSLTGTGLAIVTNPSLNVFNVDVPVPNIVGAGGISVTGTWPDLTIVYTPVDDGCCGGDGSTGGGTGQGITDLTGSGIASATVNGTLANVNVPAPNFNGVGVTISGSWPNLTFTVTAGGVGSVTSVTAGTGLSLTGNPAVNPTLLIANTGVTAGVYGDVTVNARGQLTYVSPAFNPISEIVGGDGIEVSRVGSSVSLSINHAEVGVYGTVELADETVPLDPLDTTSAVTPAVLNNALESLVMAQVAGVQSYTSAPDANYVNTISASAVSVTLADATEKCVVYAEVTVVDSAAPATPVPWALGVFALSPAVVKVQARGAINEISQSLSFVMTGPFNGTLGLVTSAIPAGAVVTDYSLWILKV